MFVLEKVDGNNLGAFQPLIPEVLQRWAVEEHGWAFYGIAQDMEAIGIIALSAVGDICRIRYLYLTPENRKQGLMDRALSELLFELKDDGYSGLEMSYIPTEYPEIDRLATGFDFTIHKTDRAYFRFKAENVRRCKAASFAPQNIMRLKVLPPEHLNTLMKMIIDNGYDLEGLGAFGSKTEANKSFREYSLVYMENNKPKGALLVQDNTLNRLPEGGAAFGKIYPEPSAANLMLIYVGTTQTKAPLYLLSGLCRNVIRDFPDEALLTGYFSLGHITNLFEGFLGVKGSREVTASLDFTALDRFYIDEELEEAMNLV